MFSLFKKNNNTPVPGWASFFSASEYETFQKELDNYFRKKNVTYTLGDGLVEVNENDFGFKTMGLSNVAQNCRMSGVDAYREVITDHFEGMISAQKFEKEFEKIAHNFEEVKKYIGVRLYSNDYIAHIGREAVIGRDFAPDIFAMVVFDFPQSVLNIKPEQSEKWNVTPDELFETGMKNIRDNYPLNVSKEDFGDVEILFVSTDHFFAPNIVFELENRRELTGKHGSLIGLPHRHAALIYPIENMDVVKAINALLPTIHGMYEEGPGSLSNNLFWYRNGVFVKLPYSMNENRIQFTPTKEFVEMLNSLV